MKLKAFTLIELLLVVGLIGILAGVTIAIINPDKIAKKGRDATRKKDMALISSALEQYYADNNAYPPTQSGNSVSSLPLSGTPKYIQSIPADPNTYSYCYTSATPFQSYVLCARMETDPASVPTGITSCQSSGTSYCITNVF